MVARNKTGAVSSRPLDQFGVSTNRRGLIFNESLHDRPQYDLEDQKIRHMQAFLLSLDPSP